MKRIASRLNAEDSRHSRLGIAAVIRARAAVVFFLAFFLTTCAAASTVPHFGGTLRVEMSERIATIDPRQWPSVPAQAAAVERLDTLIFDRLVRLDEHGM